jgi:hypothetical protein
MAMDASRNGVARRNPIHHQTNINNIESNHQKNNERSVDTLYSWLGNSESSISEARPPVSSKCWKTAMAVFHPILDNHPNSNNAWSDHQDPNFGHRGVDEGKTAVHMCAVMPEYQHKLLALEMARCHVFDLGKALFYDYPDDSQIDMDDDTSPVSIDQCDQFRINDEVTLHACLKLLTDTGIVIYSNSVSYVQHLCTRLTHEMLLEYQQETQRQAIRQYALMVNHSMEHMQQWSDWSNQYADQMKAWLEMPTRMQHELTHIIQTTIHEQIQTQLQKHIPHQLQEQLQQHLPQQLEALWQPQSQAQEAWAEQFWDTLAVRQAEDQERSESWSHYQTALWQQHARAMERHRSSVDEQRSSVLELAQQVEAAAAHLQPLYHWQSWGATLGQGLSWLSFVVYVVLVLDGVYLMTLWERGRAFRSHQFTLLLLATLVEGVLRGWEIQGWIVLAQRQSIVSWIRQWSLVAQGILYIMSVIYSFIGPFKQESPYSSSDLPDDDTTTPTARRRSNQTDNYTKVPVHRNNRSQQHDNRNAHNTHQSTHDHDHDEDDQQWTTMAHSRPPLMSQELCARDYHRPYPRVSGISEWYRTNSTTYHDSYVAGSPYVSSFHSPTPLPTLPTGCLREESSALVESFEDCIDVPPQDDICNDPASWMDSDSPRVKTHHDEDSNKRPAVATPDDLEPPAKRVRCNE